MVRVHHKVAVKEKMSLKSIVAGLKFVHKTKIVLGSITLDLFAVLLGGASAMLPVYAKDILHVDTRGLGWLQAALPLGSLLMTAIMVHRPPLQKSGSHTSCGPSPDSDSPPSASASPPISGPPLSCSSFVE